MKLRPTVFEKIIKNTTHRGLGSTPFFFAIIEKPLVYTSVIWKNPQWHKKNQIAKQLIFQ